MVARRKTSPARVRPIRLITQVVAGDVDAWKRFVEAYLGFLYSLAWRYARGDVDVASELVLVALEGLRRPDADGVGFFRLRRYLESMERYGGRSRFVTWLALVVKNLFRDWYREREGRRLLPKEIAGLQGADQEIYQLLFWDGFSELEAFEHLRQTRPELVMAEFEQRVELVYASLSERNLWAHYQDLRRRAPPIGLLSCGPDGVERWLPLADPRIDSRPDRALERNEARQAASRISEELFKAIEALPPATRRVARLTWFRDLKGEEVRRIMGFRKRQRVYDELAKAKRKILAHLTRIGLKEQDFFQASQVLDDWDWEKNHIG